MSEEGPKLYTHKPKKARTAQLKAKDSSLPKPTASSSSTTTTTKTTKTTTSSVSAAAAASYKMGSPPPPPPQPPKESFARRYKFLWPLLLAVNLTVGAYLFMRTKKKDTDLEEEVASTVPSAPTTTASVTEKPIPLPTISEVVKLREPIPENQQRELFKWILEEKRKVKPKDADEKKRNDDEKAILKQLIRAKSIPSI